jgi:hypothetical protein
MTTEYPVTSRNRLRRRHERGHYDHETVHAILDAAMVCHIAYVIDGQPSRRRSVMPVRAVERHPVVARWMKRSPGKKRRLQLRVDIDKELSRRRFVSNW